MKKRILMLSLLAICLSVYIGGTLAYFTTSDTAHNVITTGNIKIELIETDAEGKPFRDVKGVVPGSVVDKVVTVKNTGDNPCWVRIKTGKEIILADERSGEADLSLIKLDFNTADWTEKDGFFCYNVRLDAGETTKPLFTKVTFDTAMDNRYQKCTAHVNVNVQAVQSENNGNTALEATGWPAN